MAEFKRIGLVGRPGHQGVLDTLRRLIALLEERSLTVVLEEQTAGFLDNDKHGRCDRAELSAGSDLVIVVGGDGSMLQMAKHIAREQVPVLGINRGKLGFLTDILPEELDARVEQVLTGEYAVESRFLLDVVAGEGGESGERLGSALNDVVLHPGKAAQMIEFELFVNDRFVYSQESDGLIVATPTGSTAYALSAGGPIMHPELNAIVLVPMYPHSLNSRPLVVDGDSEIRIVVSPKESLEPQLSCDGEVRYQAKAGDHLIVRKKPARLQLIHPPQFSFYESCRSKLGWGSRLRRPD